ncbi:hypothetical protein Taro_048356, partial [Colocasia esculenta]|nr:hypothetical protein [Colocasia esculenta]
MGFRIEGDQVIRGPAVEPEPEPPVENVQEEIAPEIDVPQADSVEQPHVEVEVPFETPVPSTPHVSPPPSNMIVPPNFFHQYHSSASTSSGGSSVPPELYKFLQVQFDNLNSSMREMSDRFELRIQRLENSVNGQFVRQQEAAEHPPRRFNRLIGTLGDACTQLQDLQLKTQGVLASIFDNTQQGLHSSRETVTQVSKTHLSFAHLVEDMGRMRTLIAHIDQEMAALRTDFSNFRQHGTVPGSSSAFPHMAQSIVDIGLHIEVLHCNLHLVTGKVVVHVADAFIYIWVRIKKGHPITIAVIMANQDIIEVHVQGCNPLIIISMAEMYQLLCPIDTSVLYAQEGHRSQLVYIGQEMEVLKCWEHYRSLGGWPVEPRIVDYVHRAGLFHLTRDVAILMGLPIDGVVVVGNTSLDWTDVCMALLGDVPELMRRGPVKLSWLRESDKTENTVPLMYLPLLEDFDRAGRYSWGGTTLAHLYRQLSIACKSDAKTICGLLTLLQDMPLGH